MNNNKNYNNNSLNNSIVNQINLNNNISFRNKKNKLDYFKGKNLPNLTERLNTEKSNDKYLNSVYLLTDSEKLKLNTIEKKKKKENSLEKSNKLNYLKTKNNHIKKRNSIQNSLILMNKGKKTQQNPINNYNSILHDCKKYYKRCFLHETVFYDAKIQLFWNQLQKSHVFRC